MKKEQSNCDTPMPGYPSIKCILTSGHMGDHGTCTFPRWTDIEIVDAEWIQPEEVKKGDTDKNAK